MSEGPSLPEVLASHVPAQIVHVAARLGIADHLAAGPRTTAELAAASGAHEPSLRRLLRGLACLGAVGELEPGRYELTESGQQLRADAPDSIHNLVRYLLGREVWRSWENLEYSVRTGRPAWDEVTGLPSFEYFAANPEQGVTFNAAMSEGTRSLAPDLVAGFDFTRFRTLVDVGGGNGTLLAAILAAVPGLRGVLCDLPAGLREASTVLAAAGVADRCEIAARDFFESVPEGADAYLMKSVIHDWDDERVGTILRNCRRAMTSAGVVLVLERILPERVDSPQALRDIISDLTMLVLTEGRERTEREFRALYAAAGLELTELVGPFSGYWLIVGAA